MPGFSRSWVAMFALVLSALLPLPSPAAAQPRLPVVRSDWGGPDLRIVGRVRTGIQPKSVTVSPDGARVWVCNFGRPDEDNVRVYDADTLELVGTVNFEGNAVETAFDADGSRAFVSNFRLGRIEVIDARSLTVIHEIEVGGHPKVIALSPDGRRLYVTDWANDELVQIDPRTYEIVRRMDTGEHPRGIAQGSAGYRIFVASMYSHQVQVFEPGSDQELSRFHPCDYPRHLVMSPDALRLYVSCSCCRQVRWIDPHTHRLRGLYDTGQNPRTIAISDDGHYLAVAGFDDSTVTLIDTLANTHRVVPIEGGEQIVGVAIRSGARLRIYVTSWLAGELIALELR